MRKLFLILAIAALTATTYAIKRPQNQTKTMTDSQLIAAIDSCIENDLPQSAEPYFAEMKQRARSNKNDKLMLSLIDKELNLNATRMETKDEIIKALDKEIEANGTPLKEMIMLRKIRLVYDNQSIIDEILNNEGKLHKHKATDVVEEDKILIDMSAFDYIMLSLAQNGVEIIPYINKWKHNGTATSKILANFVELNENYNSEDFDEDDSDEDDIDEEYVEEEPTKDQNTDTDIKILNEIDNLAFSPETKSLANLAWGIYYIKRAKESEANGSPDKTPTAVVSDSISDKALEHLNNAKKLIEEQTNNSCKKQLYGNIVKSIDYIIGKKISITAERTSMSNKYVSMLITTKNIDKVGIDVYKHKKIFDIKKETPILHTEINIPKAKGRISEQNTYTELKGLPEGQYIIVAQHDDLKSFCQTLVTNITAEVINSNTERLLAVMNSSDGKPMTEATVDGEKVDYMGMTSIHNKNYKYDVTIANGDNDKISFDLYGWHQNEDRDRTSTNYQMVTDRGIYRPGQDVKFKLWKYMANSQKMWAVDKPEKIRITLRSHNWREIAHTTVSLNNMGTAWGEIKIPDDVDLGYATLVVGNDNYSEHIRIEEYKRTGNSLVFDPISKAYCLGDTVSLSGKLISADKKPVANANVTINDTIKTKTDENGHFEHAFTATVRHNSFSVKATDMAGETTEGYRSIEAEEGGVIFSLSTQKSIYLRNSDEGKMTIETKNCDHQPLGRDVHFIIDRVSFENVIKPDLFQGWYIDALDTTFGAPHLDIYHENNKFKTIETVTNFTQNVEGTLSLPVDINEMGCGIYRITATTTSLKGKEISDVAYFNVIEPNREGDVMNNICLSVDDKTNSNVPGGEIDINLSSRLSDANILVCAEFAGKIIYKQYVELSAGTKRLTISIPQEKKNYKVLHVVAITAKDNSRYENKLNISIREDTNDNLDMTISTLRDHSTPGTEETCTIAIKADNNTSKIEMLASMYDTRLDRITSNHWFTNFHKNRLWSNLNTNSINPTIKNFKTKESEVSYNYGNHSSYDDIVDCLSSTNLPEYSRDYMSIGMFRNFASGSRRLMKAMAEPDAAPMMFEESDQTLSECEEVYVKNESQEAPAPSPMEIKEENNNEDFIRTDFRETVFFTPDLTPDKDSNVTFSFTMPDNITTYKLRAIAHNADMKNGYIEKDVIVTKPLTVKAWLPRVVTEGDTIDITMDITSDLPADSITTKMLVNGDESCIIDHPEPKRWRIAVPTGVDSLQIEYSATSGKHTDGERHIIPVRQLYQEVNEGQTFMLMEPGTYDIANPFADSPASTVKFTSFNYNASAWIEILRTLPYLNDYPYPTSDTYIGQIESSAIAILLKKRDDIREVVSMGDNAFAEKHQMEKNSPWVLFNQYQQKHDKDVRKMLTGNKAENTMSKAMSKLKKMQKGNGAFPWMDGMDESEYMTSHILSTLGNLVRFNLIDAHEVNDMCLRGQKYIETLIKKEVDQWEKDNVKNPVAYGSTLYNLYTLTCIGDIKALTTDAKLKKAIAAIPKASKMRGTSEKLLAAIILNRIGRKEDAQLMLQSACENLVRPDEHTAHISKLSSSWWDNTTLTHSMLIIAMNEINVEQVEGDQKRVANWLVKEKRSNHWGDNQSTSRAVLALLTQCTDNRATDAITWNEGRKAEVKTYYSTPFTQADKNVKIVKNGKMASWGSWQQTALMPTDKMKAMNSEEISITRTIEGGNNVGDKVVVTLTVTTAIDMDYVRISDYRAAAYEPVDQTSGYRGWWWLRSISNNLTTTPHYYSPRDESVDIFVAHLQRGVNTFSYECYITNGGEMNAGYAEVICTYADGLEAHTEGSRTQIERQQQ